MTDSTNQDEKLLSIRNEVFRKAGRNLYLFQQVEKLLKHLNTISNLAGPISKLEKIAQIKREKSNSSNMGPLVKNLIENIYTTAEKLKVEEASNDSLGDINEVHIRTRFNIETTPEYIETRKRELKELVRERNRLVHHIFSNVNHDSLDRYIEIDAFLEEQRERIVAEHEYLRVIVNTFAESSKAHYDFMTSPVGVKHLDLMLIQQSSLVQKLIEISLQAARPDGWTSLAKAGNDIKKLLPDAFDKLKEQFGFKTLKDVLLACELFDLLDEETNKGGKRWFYKLKPDEPVEQSA